MAYINDIKAYEILDSRGIPTLLTEVKLNNGITASASVPSGASTGSYEAVELRDKNKKRYNGKGVLNNIKIINSQIIEVLQGLNVNEQRKIDSLLIEIDGTNNKRKIGANTILSVSLAVAKASAKNEELELFKYLGGINTNFLPIPLVNVINGGAHANNNLDIQEYMLAPVGAKSFSEAIRWSSEIFYIMKDMLEKKKLSTAVGDEGGFAVDFKNNIEPIEFLIKAIKKAKLNPEKQVMISLDVASTEFFIKNKYATSSGKNNLSSSEMVSYLSDIRKKYPIFSIEDGCAENDWDGWIELNQSLSKETLLVGDDLFVTNKKRLLHGIKNNAANSILIKPNQIGSLSETLDTINLSQASNIETIISHRSGETEENFIADLCVGTNSRIIKTGSVTRSERCAKYNRLLYIEKNNKELVYAGLTQNA